MMVGSRVRGGKGEEGVGKRGKRSIRKIEEMGGRSGGREGEVDAWQR